MSASCIGPLSPYRRIIGSLLDHRSGFVDNSTAQVGNVRKCLYDKAIKMYANCIVPLTPYRRVIGRLIHPRSVFVDNSTNDVNIFGMEITILKKRLLIKMLTRWIVTLKQYWMIIGSLIDLRIGFPDKNFNYVGNVRTFLGPVKPTLGAINESASCIGTLTQHKRIIGSQIDHRNGFINNNTN